MSTPTGTQVKEAVECLAKDLEMLKDGTWQPDPGSVADSLENVYLIAEYLGVPLGDNTDD